MSGYSDIVKSSVFHHLLYYRDIPSGTLKHKHQTASIVCTQHALKEITKKYNLLVEGDIK
jgi:hypothetical protein